MAPRTRLHLAVALEGTGWHPAAWREPEARSRELLTAVYWTDLVREAEAGRLDFATIEDSLSLQSSTYDGIDGRTDQVRGRLDAVLVASRVAPHTRRIGLVPSATVTHTEPFHLSKAIATLDYVSTGRRRCAGAGLGPQARRRPLRPPHNSRLPSEGPRSATGRLVGHRPVRRSRRLRGGRPPALGQLEDDAEIRDAATGRFIDRDRLHYIDFEGRWFGVKGPSIVPRPPQGQPLVTALAHTPLAYRLAARTADVVFVTPHDADQAGAIVGRIREEQAAARRGNEPLHIFGDLVVFLDSGAVKAAGRKARLDARAGEGCVSDAPVLVGTRLHRRRPSPCRPNRRPTVDGRYVAQQGRCSAAP